MNKHIISAEILPLEYKHYGTVVRLHLSDGRKLDMNVWISGGAPSNEACKEWDTDRAGWEANVEVDDGWGYMEPIQNLFPCDSHYQSQYELEVCQEIVKAVCGD